MGRNGQLRGNIQSGVNFDQFRHGLLEGLKDQEAHDASSASNCTVSASSAVDESTLQEPDDVYLAGPETHVTPPSHLYPEQDSNPAQFASHQPSTQPPLSQLLSANVEATLTERRQRLEADQTRREAQELAKRRAKARAQQEEKLSKASQDPTRASQLSHAQQQRRRQQEARQERERILKIIENDKLERRHRLELQRESNLGDSSANAQIATEVAQAQSKIHPPPSAKQCALRIRLFDGSSLHSTFPITQNLNTHVRVWVDTERTDGAAPYTFKQVMTPNNNRAISISEEMESLETLGLVPNATLIMVPTKKVSTAYYTGADGDLVTKAARSAGHIGATIYAFLVSIWLMVTSALGTVLGIKIQRAQEKRSGGARTEMQGRVAEDGAQSESKATGVAISGNVRTLRDQDSRRDDRQLYNGNQVPNFLL